MLAAAPLFAAPTPRVDAAASLLESERAVTRDLRALGIRACFLKWIDPGAVILNPLPSNARQVYTKLPSTGAGFARYPMRVVTNAAGDFGWATGRWIFKNDSAATAVDYRGDYATVWRRKGKAGWKILFDAGAPHAAIDSLQEAPRLEVLPGSGGLRDPAGKKRGFQRARARFASAVADSSGTPGALLQFGAPDISVLREGRKAVEGLVAAHDSLASWGGEVRLTLLGEFEASSGDLACEYGSWVPAGKASRVSGCYLHVWKRAPDGGWKLAVDYIQRNPRAAH